VSIARSPPFRDFCTRGLATEPVMVRYVGVTEEGLDALCL
jgi:hypothetical protein